MADCIKCGAPLREGAAFCTKCGAEIDLGSEQAENARRQREQKQAEQREREQREREAWEGAQAADAGESGQSMPLSDIPLIALAPVDRINLAKRLGRIARLVLTVLIVVVLSLGGIWVAVKLRTQIPTNPFTEVESTTYSSALMLVNDVRSDAFEAVIEDLIRNEGSAENYDFITDYQEKFKSLLTETSTQEEKDYVDACFYVWYTEYMAQRYEYLSENGGLFKFRYDDDAANYRTYANYVYGVLTTAESSVQLANIKTYCEARGIFTVGN